MTPTTPGGAAANAASFKVSTRQRADFAHPLIAYVFDVRGELVERTPVRDGSVTINFPAHEPLRARVFVAPDDETFAKTAPTPAALARLGAYEPVLRAGERFVPAIDIPGPILDFWPFCRCWVRGRVVRQSDNRAICHARVHICEVDRLPWLIARLPDRDIFRLRDDLLDVLRAPPIRWPIPGPDPDPLARAPLRFADKGAIRGFNPQPDPPIVGIALNPQPLPPLAARRAALRSDNAASRSDGAAIEIEPALKATLASRSAQVVRDSLAGNWQLLVPWLCHWPHWWPWLRCDEVAVVETDGQGRFETTLIHRCADQPDLYFWVEFDFGSGFETVYRPGLACHIWWNYRCGSEVTIRVADARVPGCDAEPDLPGSQVVVMAIGNDVAIGEIDTGGLVGGAPFGATLELRADFSRSELIDTLGVPFYRWSYRRLSGPDGVATSADAASAPIDGVWRPLTRSVYRHYRVGTTYPSEVMGPVPPVGGTASLFRIRPAAPPAGAAEWYVADEHVDLATGYFETASLPGTPTGAGDDLAAGRYELKLELFDSAGALVDWTARGIDLRLPNQAAPFGTATITTSPAGSGHRILSAAGHTLGFRMVVRVDNNRCSAEVLPVGGAVTPDPLCGFHTYGAPGDNVVLGFVARHPNRFATYSLTTVRGEPPPLPAASTGGTAGLADGNGFGGGAGFAYAKSLAVSELLGACSNAAFAQTLHVAATATNGYGLLSNYDASDVAAFALAAPCPPCPPCNCD